MKKKLLKKVLGVWEELLNEEIGVISEFLSDSGVNAEQNQSKVYKGNENDLFGRANLKNYEWEEDGTYKILNKLMYLSDSMHGLKEEL